MIVALLAACADDAPVDVDEGFRVIGVVPEDGAIDAVEVQIPELRFSEAADMEACTADVVRLDAVHDDMTVAFGVDVALTSVDMGAKIQLEHDDPFLTGWTYAITVRGGEDGCANTKGDVVRDFASLFTVP